MAKKAKKEIEIKEDELLGGNVAEVEVTEEVKAVIKPVKKEKTFLGYHPITGVEVWM